jgi:Rrf2 family protein
MTHLSLRSEYAIKALVCLALGIGGRPVQAREIASFGGIPAKFLERVMQDLRQAGLVGSRRGKGGGYVLARDPDGITFAAVIDLIEGSDGGKGRMRRDDAAEQLVAPVWHEVREATRDILEAATIAGAAARAGAHPMYYI